MKTLIVFLGIAGALSAQKTTRPDLSGVWQFGIDLPPIALKTESGVRTVDQSARHGKAEVPGALKSTEAPVYKAEFRQKVKDLEAHESKTDPVFYCGRPGVPRIGPPRKIVQLPTEMIFLYEDISGDPYRIIRMDGKGHKPNANPSYYGDSIARWEGDKLIVDVTSFVEDGWFGEDGYFHSDALHVIERLWRVGPNLAYQYTVEDPKVLESPWTAPARLIKPSTEPLEESPKCTETDASRLVNDDHHLQR